MLETTGIAEPAAILDGLGARVPASAAVRASASCPAGVVCVVDAETGGDALDDARGGARAGDRRRSRAAREARRRVGRRRARDATRVLDALAPHAERASFPLDDAGALAMTAWVVEPRKLRAWSTRRAATTTHEHGATTTTAASSSR